MSNDLDLCFGMVWLTSTWPAMRFVLDQNKQPYCCVSLAVLMLCCVKVGARDTNHQHPKCHNVHRPDSKAFISAIAICACVLSP